MNTGQAQRQLAATHLYLRAATALVETPKEQLDRLESEYQDALARANELSARLDVMLADARAKNASILQRSKPICDQLGGASDDSGTCVFTCPHNDPAACDAKTRDFNHQAAALIQEKQSTMTNLKAFASLVRAAWTDAATKKQAWEKLQAQLETH
jgi:hypothetical protein